MVCRARSSLAAGDAEATAAQTWVRAAHRWMMHRYDYAGVMCRLIAYSSSSAFVLTFNVSIIRYL